MVCDVGTIHITDKIKLKQSKGWSEASEKFDVLDLINTINSIIFKFKEHNYIPISLHQSETNFYNLHQGIMSNADYVEKINKLAEM